MTKKKTPNDLYWEAAANQQIRDEYAAYLRAKGDKSTPVFAWSFAIEKIHDGYRERTERDLILLLAGRLPDGYD